MRAALEAFCRILPSFTSKSLPSKNPESAIFLRAEFHPALFKNLPEATRLEQTFKPLADLLPITEASPIDSMSQPEVDLCLVLGSRNKQENLWNFARAYELTKVGGELVMALENNLGGEGLSKKIREFFPQAQSEGLRRSRIISLRKSEQSILAQIQDWLDLRLNHLDYPQGLVSHCASFSALKADEGSVLLMRALPDSLVGSGADFGAGWGLLSHHILSKPNQIDTLHLVDAELYSLHAAQENLAEFADNTNLHYHWHDLSKPFGVQQLDWIICNPPFHDTTGQRSELLDRFFVSAAASLKKGGTLLYVAPKHLKTAARLPTTLGRASQLDESGMYEVIQLEKLL